MTLRRFLLLPLAVSIGAFIYFSSEVAQSFRVLLDVLQPTWQLVFVILLALVLQLCGHLVRSKKASYLFGPIKKGSVKFQFRALSIGYLFNALLPLRLGELVRAKIIAEGLNVSFGVSLVLIIFERALDAIILGSIGLVFFLLFSGGEFYTYALILFGAIAVGLLYLVRAQRPGMLRFWHGITAWFNTDIKNSLRFKLWSIIYGLSVALRGSRMPRYIALTLCAWLSYGLSVLVLALYFVPGLSLGAETLVATAPYYGISLPSGPASLGSFSDISNGVTSILHISHDDLLVFNLVSWALLVIPMASIGAVLLFMRSKEHVWRTRPVSASDTSLMQKLSRSEDISREMASFLDNYFANNNLSRIVHQLEATSDFRLLKYFKGGSDAITILVQQGDRKIVKKIIPLEFENRLKAQYDWLKRHGGGHILEAYEEEKAQNFYAINLDFDPQNEAFYDFIHKAPIGESRKALSDVWKTLYKHVYGTIAKPKTYKKDLVRYIDTHIFGCFDKAASVDPQLLAAAEPEHIMINGREYDNFYQILERIKLHPKAWHDLATYRAAEAVHGDVIVDNLLISRKNKQPLIIDPAPDGNIIVGPVFDFGKNIQSLYCGYEFLLRDEDPVTLGEGGEINFRDTKSSQYTQLAEYVHELAGEHLTEAEQKAMIFHGAALFIRRLKHQVYYTPANVLKFYAVGVRTLNEFLAQYDEKKPR